MIIHFCGFQSLSWQKFVIVAKEDNALSYQSDWCPSCRSCKPWIPSRVTPTPSQHRTQLHPFPYVHALLEWRKEMGLLTQVHGPNTQGGQTN